MARKADSSVLLKRAPSTWASWWSPSQVWLRPFFSFFFFLEYSALSPPFFVSSHMWTSCLPLHSPLQWFFTSAANQLSVVFSPCVLLHLKYFQSFQLSFYSFGEVFCVTCSYQNRRKSRLWLPTCLTCRIKELGWVCITHKSLQKNLPAKAKPVEQAFIPFEPSKQQE